MPVALAVLLGLIQGLTEFLPISSDGHLAVAQVVFGRIYDLARVPLAYDVFLHFATLLVTMHYLRREIFETFRDLFAKGAAGDHIRRFVLVGAVASVPAAIVGIFFENAIEETFHSLAMAGVGFLVTAFALESAHRKQSRNPQVDTAEQGVGTTMQGLQLPTLGAALIIGTAQSLALLPGVSRSGMTIVAALLLGLAPRSAVRFSFLLSLPAVAGAVVFKANEIQSLPSDYNVGLIVGFLVTLATGAAAIRLVPIVVTRLKLRLFALYLVPLAILCLWFS